MVKLRQILAFILLLAVSSMIDAAELSRSPAAAPDYASTRHGKRFATNLGAALREAVSNRNLKLVKELLDKGADVNSADKKTGTTALISSIGTDASDQSSEIPLGNTEIVRILLAKGAAVNAKDIWGRSALSFATSYGNTEVIELLRAKGAR